MIRPRTYNFQKQEQRSAQVDPQSPPKYGSGANSQQYKRNIEKESIREQLSHI